jgi:integrase
MQFTKENTRLVRNKSGKWEIRWTEPNPAGGRGVTRCHSTRTTDRLEAERYWDLWLGTTQVASRMVDEKTIDELAQAYEDQHVELQGRTSAQKWSLLPIKRALGDLPLAALTGQRITEYVRARRRQGRADGTIRRELGALRTALDWCRKNGELASDTILPHIPLPAGGQARMNTLTEAEEARLWETARGIVLDSGSTWREKRTALFVCLVAETAARSEAIETLTWDRVDLAGRMIDYRDVSRRATKKRRVPIPISDALFEVLDHVAKNKLHPTYVLGSAGSTRNGFMSFCERYGFDVTRHDLRRTWASLRAKQGVPMSHIAGVLGDTVETTEKHYAHLHPDYLRDAVNHRRRSSAA